jgi:putative ABC transport system permease protein
MTLWLIVRKSLRQHALSTIVTALSIALAGGLLMSVWTVKNQAQATFTGINEGFDAVLGARGSKLQLVLNSIFHLESSPGNLAWADYQDVAHNPNVELAVPIAVGDNYHGYRLVGTTPEYFSQVEYAPGEKFAVQPGGAFFDPTRKEAVVGDFVARKMNLKVGDTFHPFHGLIFDEKSQHAETYVVTGILKPSNTPADRVIWTPLEGIQKMTGHDPKAATEVSAVLVKLKAGSAMSGFRMDMMYNKQGSRLTFAWPIGRVVAELFDKIGWFDKVLALVSYLVAVVATASILASIYNSMNERRREIAILRALGARRTTIFAAILLESASISAIGMMAGFLVYGAIVSVVAHIMRAQTGVVIDPLKFSPIMVFAPVGLVLMGAVAGVVPAIKAYRTAVAENLAPLS